MNLRQAVATYEKEALKLFKTGEIGLIGFLMHHNKYTKVTIVRDLRSARRKEFLLPIRRQLKKEFKKPENINRIMMVVEIWNWGEKL